MRSKVDTPQVPNEHPCSILEVEEEEQEEEAAAGRA